MDLLSLKLRLADRHARILHTDAAAGQRGADLEGARFERLASVAAPLITELERRASVPARPAHLRAVSIDTVTHVVRASLVGGAGSPGASYGGAEWSALAPLLQPLVRAALEEVQPPRPPPSGSPSEARFWDELYRSGADRWELGRPAPPLQRYFRGAAPRGLRVLVVGCGRGHEARLLSSLGADVVAIDFSAEAIAAARALGGPTVAPGPDGVRPGRLEFRQRDLFDAAQDGERFQLVVEHSCYCSIEPWRRREYVRAVAELLEPQGELIGLFWAHRRAGGPPFCTSEEELRDLFAPRFTVVSVEVPHDSVAAHAGEELLMRMQLR